MKRLWIAVPVLTLAGFITGCGQAQLEREKEQLAKAKEEIALTKAELAKTNAELVKVKAKLKEAKIDLEAEVALPVISNAQPPSPGKYLVINITKEGKYKIEGKFFTQEQLFNLLGATRIKYPQKSALIRSDWKAKVKYLLQVVGICNRIGIKSRVAVLEKRTE